MAEAVARAGGQAAPALTLERELPYPPEMVFKAWTETEALRQWMGPAGYRAPDAEIDARVGGAYVIPMISPEGKVPTVRGVIRELVPNRLLRFSWAWDQEDGSAGRQMEVTVELHATEAGTRLVIHHSNFIDEQAREMHGQGWTSCLDSLADFLES